MATITLEYDGRNSTINKLIDVLIGLGAKVSTQQKTKKTEGGMCMTQV